MQLLIDIGNSRVKWTLFGGEGIRQSQSLENSKWQSQVRNNRWLAELKDNHPIASIVFACVGNKQLVSELTHLAENEAIKITQVETAGQWQELKNAYTNYAQMGVDRWLAMMAAWENCHCASMVIDCGTAITIDAIAKNGSHLGGHIVAGLSLQKSKLLEKTTKVNAELSQQNTLMELASNTSDAVNFGTLQLVVDYLNNSWDRFQKQFPNAELFITGGDGELVSKLLDYRDNFHRDLVLEGIMLTINTSKEL